MNFLYKSGVYEIKNKLNGKRYVGSAKNLSDRLNKHRSLLVQNKHHSIKLQRAWNKYGENSFTFSVLFYCDIKDLVMYEQRAIDKFNVVVTGYNMAPMARSSLGIKRSEETKRKLSLALTGRHISEEVRKRMSLANTGRLVSKETGDKISKVKTGHKTSLETRLKIAASCKGRKINENQKKALFLFSKKRKSLETRMKISFGRKRYLKNKLAKEDLSA